MLAPNFCWPPTNKITGTQHHHKLILYSSYHVQRVLVVTTNVEQGKIRVGNERLLVITGASNERTLTQRAMSYHHWWYLCLLHWMIQSSIQLSYPRFVSSHSDLHITLLVITGALIARTFTQIEMDFHHLWYLCLLHWMIQSSIHLSCTRFVNINPALHRTLIVITGARTAIQRAMICHQQWYLCLLHWMMQSSIRLKCTRYHPALHRKLLMITGDLIARTVTQIEMSCHNWWYLCLLHWMIQSLIHLRCTRFVNSIPTLHRTQHQSRKLIQYLFGIHLILQIPWLWRPPRIEVAIFMNAWLICLSWNRHNDNSMS